MKFTTTLLAASAAAIALTTGTEARLRGSHGRQLDFYGGSKTAYPLYGRTGNNPLGYDEDDLLGDCGEDWYTHSGSNGCRSLFVKNDGSYGDEDDDLGAMVDRPSDWRDEDDVLGWNPPSLNHRHCYMCRRIKTCFSVIHEAHHLYLLRTGCTMHTYNKPY